MKLRTKSRLKGILIPAIAALFLGAGVVACSSSSEEGAPDAAMVEDGAVSNTDPLANDANATEGENGADAEGNVAENGNNEELSNLVNDGSANAASAENPAADPALTNEAGADPFANPAATNADEAAMAAEGGENTALNNGSDPFAPADGSDATVASESTPAVDNPAADPALAADPMAADPMAADPMAADPMAADAAAADPMAADGAAADPFAAPAGDVASESVPTTDGAAAPMVSTPAAAGGYVPENGSKMAYYVQKGDTLGSIAQKILGSKAKWQGLAQANNLQDPNKIYAGDALYYTLSDASRGFADQYEGAARQTVSVGRGDTLSTISAKVFGSQGSWRTLWKENPQVTNPDRIFPGQTLFYRAGAAATAEAPMSYDEGVATQE